MPISSAAHKRTARRDAGFSLVELLAVLAIMSLMVGAVVLNLPERDSAVERDSARLVAGLQARLDAAALAGEMRAIRLDADGLALLADRNGVLSSELEAPWPATARVSAREGTAAIDLGTDTPPVFWIEPYGVVPELSLSLRGRKDGVRIGFGEDGRLVREPLR